MTKETIQSFTYRITTANKTEMIAILYDIGRAYIKDASECLDASDKAGFRTNVNCVRNTVKELMASVNTSEELGRTFLSLYIFCNKQLTKAFLDYDKEALNVVDDMFKELGEVYHQISGLDKSKPVMNNAETVYSGLTYNRSLSPESMTSGSSNRGFLA